MTTITRDFTVAVFVVHNDHVLLHPHRKLGIWLPPGGHIEPNELPDEAALREVEEESGLAVELVGDHGVKVDDPDAPVQLVRPEGIQLENISPGHQHIDPTRGPCMPLPARCRPSSTTCAGSGKPTSPRSS